MEISYEAYTYAINNFSVEKFREEYRKAILFYHARAADIGVKIGNACAADDAGTCTRRASEREVPVGRQRDIAGGVTADAGVFDGAGCS